MKKVYLAGPDVFLPNAKDAGKWMVHQLAEQNLQGLYPLDNEIEGVNGHVIGADIAAANRKMIEECDGVLANLQPFRGPSADVGTVWECAYAKGLGKIVVGYGFDHRTNYRERVLGKVPHDGMMIEDFGVFDNIMLVYGLDGSKVSWYDALFYLKHRLESA
jgi:nucleoside 2-deoxyribosyltransferase